MLRTLMVLPLMLRSMCGGDDGGGECPGAWACAVASQTCATQQDCNADQSCIDFGEPDARCGSAAACAADRTCANPAETCICFD